MNIKNTPLFAESWNVAYRNKPVGTIIKDIKSCFSVIPNSIRYWAADPMVFKYQKKTYIFAELYDYVLRRGTIGYTVFENNKFTKWKQVIVENHHLSYPNVFMIGDNVFMMPESSACNKLVLYKAVDFPDKWELFKVVKNNVKWVDTTLRKNGSEYLGFTQQITNPTLDLVLRFSSDLELLACYTMSKNSSVYRCGGRLFEYDNYLVRVCQDCTSTYGGALIFRFCNVSNPIKEYKTISITPDIVVLDRHMLRTGIHTYTAQSDIEVIDIKTRRFNLINLYFRILNKLKSK